MITKSIAKVPDVNDQICQGAIYKNVKYNYIVSEDDKSVKVIEYEFPLAIVISQSCDVISMEQLLLQKVGKATKFMPSILMCPIYDKQMAKQGNHVKKAFSELEVELDTSSALFNSSEYKVAENNWHYRYHPFLLSVDGKTVIDESVIDFKHYFSVPMSYLVDNRENRLFQLEDLFAEQITLKFAVFLTRVPIP